jgi:hypothetical protein
MAEPPSLRFIRDHIQAKRYRLTKHATIVRLERGITIAELRKHYSMERSLNDTHMTSHIHPVWCLVG